MALENVKLWIEQNVAVEMEKIRAEMGAANATATASASNEEGGFAATAESP